MQRVDSLVENDKGDMIKDRLLKKLVYVNVYICIRAVGRIPVPY